MLNILSGMPTPELLHLTLVSHRICALVLRIIQNRLVAASELESHSLLLECYHPSQKLTEPPYFCTYLGTDGLTRYDPSREGLSSPGSQLANMRSMYSRFRPYRRELETGGRRVRRPSGDIPGSRTYPGTATDQYKGETIKQVLHLDEDELFTQLVAQCNLVKLGPRNGLFTAFVEVEEGVIRIKRDWLKKQAANGDSTIQTPDVMRHAPPKREAVWDMGKDERETLQGMDDGEIRWSKDDSKNTGLRFKVRERKLRRDAPILIRADEVDLPVSYEVEFDGTQLTPLT